MPMAPHYNTSIQIGCLKAYLDEKKYNVKVHNHSAHLSIILRTIHTSTFSHYISASDDLGFIVMVGYLKKFGLIERLAVNSIIKKLISSFNQTYKTNINKKTILNLEEATIAFIKDDLVPKLDRKELNIVGFSLSSQQLYLSIFCYHYLREYYPDYRILFLFGGNILNTYPSTLGTLKNYRINALAVIGEGELKLERIVQTCLKYPNAMALDLLNRCEDPKYDIYKIDSVGEEDSLFLYPMVELKSIESLPDPDHTEYFEVLEKYSATKEIYLSLKQEVGLSLEGSRGCAYNKCDFCGLNCNWCEYRGKSAKTIYKNLMTMLKRYGVTKELQFTDSNSNLWHEELLDLLLGNRMFLPIKAEIRSNHDESFYVKQSLAAYRSIPVGIESFSDDLLKKMNKGATLISNLQTLKYINELGMENVSGLIINHPKSTLQDIKDTRQVALCLKHIPKLDISPYVLDKGSPIYKGLKKGSIKYSFLGRKNLKLPKELFKFYDDVFMEVDENRTSHQKINNEWRKFWDWYDKLDTQGCYLNVKRLSERAILIKDNRFGKIEEHIYSGDAERVYTQCHKGQTVEQLNKETGIAASNVQKILNSFVKKRLMISSNDRYLSIALRPKEELINNYYLQRSKVMC